MYKFLLILVLILFSGQTSAQILSNKFTQTQKLLQSEEIIGYLSIMYSGEIESCDSNTMEIVLDSPETLDLVIDQAGIRAVLTQFYTVTCVGKPVNCIELDTGNQNADTICPIRHENFLKTKRAPAQKRPVEPDVVST